MNLQEAMFAEVENWSVSGESKTVFKLAKFIARPSSIIVW
jgi:hypothetical protein